LRHRYRIERKLGQGGMGDVYLAFDLKHQRQVAIKVLPADLAMALGPERFLREIRIAARLAHPHILPLHDSGEAAGLLYYVMPFVEGESLRDRLRRENRLPVPTAVAIAGEIAGALEYAHRLGVIHRDVKPENILIAGGHALLADFGIARPLEADERITESGSPVGTAAYMSPEQAAGSFEVDERSDTYSLGCVLYEMLAGSQEAAPLLAKRFSDLAPPVRSVRSEVPETLSDIVSRAMALPREDRFSSMTELAAALREPTWQRSRRRWIVIAALALLVITGAAVTAVLIRHSTGGNSKRVLIGEFINRTGGIELAPLGDIATDYIARGLAATRLLDEIFDARSEPVELKRGNEGAGGVRSMARSLGAGTAVWGSYYRLGDSVHFEAQILETGSGKVLLSLQPVTGPAADPTAIVETLRQRVMAGFAVIFGRRFEAWKTASIPPTFDAYREMLAGGEDAWQFDFNGALDHYRRASALDPSYTGAQIAAALILSQRGECREADSLGQQFSRTTVPLPPADRATLDWALAECQGDMEAILESSRAMLRMAPRSIGASLLVAIHALELFRPHEAIGILKGLHPNPAEFVGAQEGMYWSFQQYAYHEMGQFDQELASARDRDSQAGEAVALAALHRTRDVEQMTADWPTRERISGWTFGPVAQCLALELHGHGQPEAAARLMEQAATWFKSHGPETTDTEGTPPCLWHMLSASYYAGHWQAAHDSYRAMVQADSTNAQARFGVGAAAAHLGDTAEARLVDRWLEQAEGRSHDRARLAAIRGDRAAAVALLRRAFHERFGGRMFIHTDPDLDSLRGYPPYEDLVRPKD
jgi:hypothetical protein